MNGKASVDRSRSGATACEHVARARPGNRQPGQPQPEHLEPDRSVARQVVAEPARVVDLRRQRPEQVELLRVGRPGDRELADDPARVVEHRGQRDPAGRRHPRRQQRGQPVRRALAGHPVLRVVRDLGHPDPLANRGHLAGDAVPGVRAVERDLLDRLLAGLLEPQRVLQPERRAPDRVRRGEPVVDRRRQQRVGPPAAPRSGT